MGAGARRGDGVGPLPRPQFAVMHVKCMHAERADPRSS